MSYIENLLSKPRYEPAGRIAERLKSYTTIGITGHANPDADALGSCVALAHGLQALGKTVHLYNASPVPNYLQWYPFTGPVTANIAASKPAPEVIVVLDCGDAERLGDIMDTVLSYPTINIDHHLHNPHFGSEANWCDAHMAATGQMVAALLLKLGIPLQDIVSELLYSALSGDTGNFSFDNTNEDTLLFYAHLLQQGLNVSRVRLKMDDAWTLKRMRFWGTITQNIELVHRNSIALVPISQAQLTASQTTKEDLEGLPEQLRRLQGVQVAGIVREDAPNECKVSLRSTGEVSVRDMMATLGGGGHRNAAGATLRHDLKTSTELVISAAKKWLDEHKVSS